MNILSLTLSNQIQFNIIRDWVTSPYLGSLQDYSVHHPLQEKPSGIREKRKMQIYIFRRDLQFRIPSPGYQSPYINERILEY